jgi:hypothetical protein
MKCRRTFTLIGLSLVSLSVAAFNYARGDENKPPSLYVTDQVVNAVTEYNAITGAFQRVLISNPLPPPGSLTAPDGLDGPNGIVVSRAEPPQLVVVNQNVNQIINGDIRVYSERHEGAPELILVPSCNPTSPNPPYYSPFAPFAILLYGRELLITDPGNGVIEVFDTSTIVQPAPGCPTGTKGAKLLGTLGTAGYQPPNSLFSYGMVVGRDGYLYVATRSCPRNCPTSGDVIRFDLATNKFKDVFISGASSLYKLGSPNGVVFGPDGRLYVSSTKLGPPSTGDNDKILIFNPDGSFVDQIDLDKPSDALRNSAPALRFGPGRLLYVTIVQLNLSDQQTGVGSVRQYNVRTKQYKDIVPPNTTQKAPTGLTFGSTNPATLVYENDDQNNNN